jgi:hypothetical protein
MSKKPAKKAGRPIKVTRDDTVAKLEAAFHLGVTDEVACRYADIHPTNYYLHLKENEDFARKIAKAKDYSRIAAGSVVLNAIERKNVDAAKWWLERKHPQEFGKPTGMQVKSGDVEIKFVGWQ